MAGQAGNSEPGAHAARGMSPAEATRLWETFRSGTGPQALQAFERLFQALRLPLIAFCRLRGYGPELAEEVADQAWVRLLAAKPRARKGFLPLLHKTAQNFCFKERAKQRTVPLADGYAAGDDPAAMVEQGDRAQVVEACVAELDPEDRAFLLFVHVHGLTRKAACELLGWDIAPSTAHQRMERIRGQLAALLKKKGLS
jgi:DNA-directed RNA polymerase specialized sigma24 family protein